MPGLVQTMIPPSTYRTVQAPVRYLTSLLDSEAHPLGRQGSCEVFAQRLAGSQLETAQGEWKGLCLAVLVWSYDAQLPLIVSFPPLQLGRYAHRRRRDGEISTIAGSNQEPFKGKGSLAGGGLRQSVLAFSVEMAPLGFCGANNMLLLLQVTVSTVQCLPSISSAVASTGASRWAAWCRHDAAIPRYRQSSIVGSGSVSWYLESMPCRSPVARLPLFGDPPIITHYVTASLPRDREAR
jgi:hypothetical protein